MTATSGCRQRRGVLTRGCGQTLCSARLRCVCASMCSELVRVRAACARAHVACVRAAGVRAHVCACVRTHANIRWALSRVDAVRGGAVFLVQSVAGRMVANAVGPVPEGFRRSRSSLVGTHALPTTRTHARPRVAHRRSHGRARCACMPCVCCKALGLALCARSVSSAGVPPALR